MIAGLAWNPAQDLAQAEQTQLTATISARQLVEPTVVEQVGPLTRMTVHVLWGTPDRTPHGFRATTDEGRAGKVLIRGPFQSVGGVLAFGVRRTELPTDSGPPRMREGRERFSSVVVLNLLGVLAFGELGGILPARIL